MLYLGKIAEERAVFITDAYGQVSDLVSGWSEKLKGYHARKMVEKESQLTAGEHRQMMVSEVMKALGCRCGGRCPSCRHIIQDVVPDL